MIRIRKKPFLKMLINITFPNAALVGSVGDGIYDHLESYSKNLKKALTTKSDFINCHAGRDFFSWAINVHMMNEWKKRYL